MARIPFPITLVTLVLILGLILVFSLGLGPVRISPYRVMGALLSRIPGMEEMFGVESSIKTIVWDFRLARALLATLTGAALAVSGVAFQGLFRNPLAEPFVIGASSGAALGATVAIVLRLSLSFGGFRPVPLAAFTGAMIAVGMVYIISQTGSGTPPAVALLLAGTALSSLFSAAVSLIMALSDRDLHQIFFWILGSLGGKSWPQLWAMLPYVLTSFILMGIITRPLDIMSFGEEAAQGMGLSVRNARFIIVVSASLATSAAVASTGIIGFVGLLAPHTARLIIGPVHRRLMPTAALLGAILLVAADNLARTVLAPMELPVGVLTAILGAPFFLYLLRSRQSVLGGE